MENLLVNTTPATISDYNWTFGDGASAPNTETTSHTYTTAGTYNLNLTVQDANGNFHAFNQTITVNPSGKLAAKSRDVPYDPDREYQRQVLAGACAAGDAAACSGLGDMYAEDGDAYTASQLKAKACAMGYQDACASK